MKIKFTTMKYLLLLTCVFSFNLANATLMKKIAFVQQTMFEKDTTIEEGKTQLKINVAGFSSNLPMENTSVRIQSGKIDTTLTTDARGNVVIFLESGSAQFFVSKSGYSDQKSRKFKTPSQYYVEYKVYMSNERISYPRNVKKPVIYLYPEKTQEMTMKLQVNGEMTFTYPVYNDGWSFTANPDGKIEMNDKEYDYLFWEGKQTIDYSKDYESGFVVSKENVISFFEEKLASIGLNSREMNDFITFWGPLMMDEDNYFVHFKIGEEYDKDIAEIELTEIPTTSIRLFMTFMPVDENYVVKEQKLPTYTREGFVLVEWGGGELPIAKTNL